VSALRPIKLFCPFTYLLDFGNAERHREHFSQ
jgi:hypothetical protein